MLFLLNCSKRRTLKILTGTKPFLSHPKKGCVLTFCLFRWFKFEKVVEALVARQIYHRDLDQLVSVINDVCSIDDEEELTAMLNFYHDLGVIVKHGRTVVLQAQWLIDLFKELITVKPYDELVSYFNRVFTSGFPTSSLRL